MLAHLLRQAIQNLEGKRDDATAWFQMGNAYEANRLYDLAAACYRQKLAMTPDDPRAIYHLALMQARLGDVDSAIDGTLRIDQLTRYPPAAWQRGFWQLNLGRLELAEASFRQATSAAPNDPAGWAGLARVYLQSGEPQRAAELLEQRLGGRPGPPYLHHLLGIAYRRTSKPDLAERELRRGRDSPPTWHDPWVQETLRYRRGFRWTLSEAKRALRDGHPEIAAGVLEKLRKFEADDREMLAALGTAYGALGRAEEAAQVFGHLIATHPDDFRAQLDLAAYRESTGEVALALGHADRSIELNPTYATAHLFRASILRKQGDTEGAERALQRAKALDPRTEESAQTLMAEPRDPREH